MLQPRLPRSAGGFPLAWVRGGHEEHGGWPWPCGTVSSPAQGAGSAALPAASLTLALQCCVGLMLSFSCSSSFSYLCYRHRGGKNRQPVCVRLGLGAGRMRECRAGGSGSHPTPALRSPIRSRCAGRTWLSIDWSPR